MCLSTAALAAFLTLISNADMTREADSITVHASERDAVWVARSSDMWCTDAPETDRSARLEVTR